ncbi:MAG TPA: tRNA (guanosine(46)-N7)-methyltransferase TrmB [Thermoanaerobaculia bacterium]|nr:tRNA (guanosine(46)-N7)-methyltransferase TrmB [Thermoanaerobaculia bacterium]
MTESELVVNPRESGFHRLDLQQLFGNTNPVILEIGSGKGRFLISTAMERPGVNLLGVEKSLHYHRLIRDRVIKRHLTNIRLINHDAFLVMRDMIPAASIAEVHVYFPDPWPRARQQKRRIIRPEALAEMRRVLADGGSGIYVTDHQEYFEAAAPFVEAEFPGAQRRVPGADDLPRTNYEAKYRAEGRPIFEIRFWK